MKMNAFLKLHPASETGFGTALPGLAAPNARATSETVLRLTVQEEIRLRPIAPGDESEMVHFHTRLSDESIYLRYFDHASLASRTQPERLKKVCTNTAESFAIVAEKQFHKARLPEILAVARLAVIEPISSGITEFAILLRDEDALASAVARILLEHVITLARGFGFQQMKAELLLSDAATLELCQQLGFQVALDSSAGVARVTHLL